MIDALVGLGLLHGGVAITSSLAPATAGPACPEPLIELILFSRQMTSNRSPDRYSDATEVVRLLNAYQMWTRATRVPAPYS
jgi:hypothetical protein